VPTSNSCIFTPTENWTHVYMNLFTRNSPYYHLLKYLLFLLKHPVYIYIYIYIYISQVIYLAKPFISTRSTDRQNVYASLCLFSSLSTLIFIRGRSPSRQFSELKNKNQLDATYYFIALLIGSTCFGHYYAHHQELATIMFITTLVVSFYLQAKAQVVL